MQSMTSNKSKRADADAETSPAKTLRNPVVADAIGFNNLGAELTSEGRHEDALDAFMKALSLSPEMSAAHINLSITYERLNRLDDALNSAKLGLRYAPDSTRAYNQLCGVYFLQKNFSIATDCYKKLDQLLPNNAEVQSQLGASLIRMGQGDKAIEMLEQVVVRTPLYAHAHNTIGFAYFKKKRYADAAKAFKRAVEIDPASVLYRFNLGISQALIQNKSGALTQYNALREIAPKRAQQIYRLIYRDKLVFVGPPK
jgi:tetratricopeptide (TPR) repeat protein